MPISFSETDCLWNALRAEKRPVVLYGTGNGGDKILDTCKKYGIKVSGVFASNGFVRNRCFRGMPVESLESIESRLGNDFVILLAFGTTVPSVAASIEDISRRHTLFIPEVPLYGGDLFNYEYYLQNKDKIENAENLLYDEESKKLFRELIAFRMTGSPCCLNSVQLPAVSYRQLFSKANYIIDCGAYTGDSTEALVSALHPRTVVAVEPDPRTYKKLSAYAGAEKRCEVQAVNAAIGAQNGTFEFSLSGNRGSGQSGASKRGKTGVVDVRTVDTLASQMPRVDLIKLDVEGDEASALDGAANTIAVQAPSVALSVYHRTEDLFALTIRISEMLPRHRLYLRRAPCIPAWDITLFAVSPDIN